MVIFLSILLIILHLIAIGLTISDIIYNKDLIREVADCLKNNTDQDEVDHFSCTLEWLMSNQFWNYVTLILFLIGCSILCVSLII